jgi:hypothetical protein
MIPTIYHQSIEKLLARGFEVLLGIHCEILTFQFHFLNAGICLFKQCLSTKFILVRGLI